jgi:hypothetical protein
MKTKDLKFKYLDKLTFKILDAQHSEKDIENLSFILKESKEARQRYLNLTRQEALLHWEASEHYSNSDVKPNDAKVISFPIIISVAATIIAMFGVWFFHKNQDYKTSSFPIYSQQTNDLVTQNFESNDQDTVIDNRFANDDRGNLFLQNFARKAPMGSSRRAFNDAVYGLRVLLNNQAFGEGGIVEYASEVTSWKRINHLSVPSENGILPKVGDQMIRFSSLEVNEGAQIAEVSETLQILDLRNFKSKQPNFNNALLKTRVYFNKGVNLYGDETEFSVSFHALNSTSTNQNLTVGHHMSSLSSDLNPETWEELNTDFSLPKETEFVVVSMSAQKTGPSSLLPSIENHYADGLSIDLLLNGENIVGPL